MIERQVKQLVRLIDDLLDASRMTRDRLHLEMEPLDLAEPLHLAIETSQPLLDAAGVTFSTHVVKDAIPIHGDRVRLSQLFANILNNAAKYSDPGGHVSLTVERVPPHVVVRVVDTGVGIPPHFLPHVFELFTHYDRPNQRTQGGLGIGLALVHRLVEMHRGDVSAASNGEGHGAEFTVKLPMAG